MTVHPALRRVLPGLYAALNAGSAVADVAREYGLPTSVVEALAEEHFKRRRARLSVQVAEEPLAPTTDEDDGGT